MDLITDTVSPYNVDNGMVVLDADGKLAVVGNTYWSHDDNAWVIILRGSARELVVSPDEYVTIVL